MTERRRLLALIQESAEDAAERAALLGGEPRVEDGDRRPPEWRSAIIGVAWWYRLSSFAYSVAGALAAAYPEALRHYSGCAWFPFRAMGVAIALNGPVSYMSDVVKWGLPSVWQTLDVVLATANTLVQVAIAVMQASGLMAFPAAPAGLHALSICVALYCKHLASRALGARDRDSTLFWHAAWHYTLPAGALAAQLWLLHLYERWRRGEGHSLVPLLLPNDLANG